MRHTSQTSFSRYRFRTLYFLHCPYWKSHWSQTPWKDCHYQYYFGCLEVYSWSQNWSYGKFHLYISLLSCYRQRQSDPSSFLEFQRTSFGAVILVSGHNNWWGWFHSIFFLDSTAWFTHGCHELIYNFNYCSSVGQLLEIEMLPDDIHCKWFFRVKVYFNVCNPIKEGFLLPRPNLPYAFINFRYEKLSNFCYKWGRIGHSVSMCPHEVLMSSIQRYGPWLQSNPRDSSFFAASSKFVQLIFQVFLVRSVLLVLLSQLWQLIILLLDTASYL